MNLGCQRQRASWTEIAVEPVDVAQGLRDRLIRLLPDLFEGSACPQPRPGIRRWFEPGGIADERVGVTDVHGALVKHVRRQRRTSRQELERITVRSASSQRRPVEYRTVRRRVHRAQCDAVGMVLPDDLPVVHAEAAAVLRRGHDARSSSQMTRIGGGP